MRRWATVWAITGAALLTGAATALAAPAPPDPPVPPGPASPRAAPADPRPSTGHETSAAAAFGWGDPNRVEEFGGPLGASWNVYDGPGHAGNGRRTPDAISIRDGILTITGDAKGSTAGMGWMPGQMYGRWEGRVQAPASDESYNALLLLWPDAEDFPEGGEIDFMEMLDHTRQTTDIFIHYGEDNSQVNGQVQIDATQWHNWAVEWTPEAITAYVDGREWYRTTDTSMFPPRPMHLCVQLDWFPEDGSGPVQESYLHLDWVKQYPLDADDAPTDEAAGERLTEVVTSSTRDQSSVALTEGAPDPTP
jgi:glycosyl hydrolase family 16